jgi:hypothetical protein
MVIISYIVCVYLSYGVLCIQLNNRRTLEKSLKEYFLCLIFTKNCPEGKSSISTNWLHCGSLFDSSYPTLQIFGYLSVTRLRVRSLQDQKNSKTFKDFFCLFSKTFQRPLRAISCRKIASVSTIF